MSVHKAAVKMRGGMHVDIDFSVKQQSVTHQRAHLLESKEKRRAEKLQGGGIFLFTAK